MMIVSVPDRLVRDPATRRVVDEAGIDVDETHPYWDRLLRDGDVAPAPESTPASPSDTKPAKPAPAQEA